MSIKLFDTHTHYDNEAFDEDRELLIPAMLNDSIAGFVAVGCNPKRNRLALDIAEKYDNAYAAVGVHPQDVETLNDDYLTELEAAARHTKTVAIGEIGLEYVDEDCDREKQKRVFKEQLSLAKRLDKPVIIHSREATEDCLKILAETRPRAVIHCFSGSAETAREMLKLGFMISFTGIVTFKNARRAVEACRAVPLESIMLETDCPYMAPAPRRGVRCDSRLAWFTAQKIAQIKGKTTDEVVEICNNNAKRFFGLEK